MGAQGSGIGFGTGVSFGGRPASPEQDPRTRTALLACGCVAAHSGFGSCALGDSGNLLEIGGDGSIRRGEGEGDDDRDENDDKDDE